jgi:hypothetical protein
MLSVRFAPASAELVSRTDFRGGENALVQATQSCDLEGAVTWLLGVNGQKPFRVTALEAPARLVLDIEQ